MQRTYGDGHKQKGKNDPDFAPLEVFNIIGYAKTATSPHEAKPYYF